MSKWFRRGAANPKLVGALIVLLIGCGIFWTYRFMSSEKSGPVASKEQFEFWCTNCKDHWMVPAAESRGWDRQGGKVLCPKCGTYNGSWGPPQEIGNVVAP